MLRRFRLAQCAEPQGDPLYGRQAIVPLRVIAETGYALAQFAETAPPSALRLQGGLKGLRPKVRDEPTRPQAISCPHVMLVGGLKFTNKRCLLWGTWS